MRISTNSSQNQAKLRKTNLLKLKTKLLTRYAKAETRNRGAQQSHRKTNLAKLRKTKLLKQKRNLLTSYAKTRGHGTGDLNKIIAKPI